MIALLRQALLSFDDITHNMSNLPNNPTGAKLPAQGNLASVMNRWLRDLRHSLSYIDALPQLTILGGVVGLLTGGIIVVFRFFIEQPQALMLGDPENFESLHQMTRVCLILGGAILLGIGLHFVPHKHREVSVSHVLDRMHNYQGKLPLYNWLVQFFGDGLAMLSGQSVGREGPVIHLGAGAASMFGHWLRLPNNSIHILVACGVAAAISASFNTPMAGVIFAMEVLSMEYTIVGFVPVILASVMGTMINQSILGDSGFITVGDTAIDSLLELPVMVLMGGVIALCAGIYIKLNLLALQFNHYPIGLRVVVAGLIAAAASLIAPQTMGLGYGAFADDIQGLLTCASIENYYTPVEFRHVVV